MGTLRPAFDGGKFGAKGPLPARQIISRMTDDELQPGPDLILATVIKKSFLAPIYRRSFLVVAAVSRSKSAMGGASMT